MNSVTNGKSNLGLTRKEKELLTLFEGNPGRCFSRGFLLKEIWGYNDNAKTRTVDVHVSRLRKKLEGRRNVVIHTVVRQGYVFERLDRERRFNGTARLTSRGEAAGVARNWA